MKPLAVLFAILAVPLLGIAQQTTLSGVGVPWVNQHIMTMNNTPFFTSMVIDATGEKVAYCGRAYFAARTGTKDISKVGIRFGAVTKAGGSGLTISLQNVSTAAGPPMQPDETQDQTVAVANANASFVANTWLQTAALSANRTVTYGDQLCVVIEYDGSGRQGADTVAITGLAANRAMHFAVSALKTASWADGVVIPNVILEYSDGSFGTLYGGFPVSAVSSVAYNTGSSPDEYALAMTFPGAVGIEAGGGIFGPANATSDAELITYEGTSAVSNGTLTLLAEHAFVASERYGVGLFAALLSLTADTTYYLALKPTSVNSVTIHYFDVAAAGHLQAHIGGEAWTIATRTDAGAWSPTTTRRPFLWPHVAAIHNGAGSGGGRIIGGAN
jgi:hypothetical protein